jgi:hypothetical protein
MIVFRSSYYASISFAQWLSHVPSGLVQAHFNFSDDAMKALSKRDAKIVGPGRLGAVSTKMDREPMQASVLRWPFRLNFRFGLAIGKNLQSPKTGPSHTCREPLSQILQGASKGVLRARCH